MNRPGLYRRHLANPLATVPQGQSLSDMMSVLRRSMNSCGITRAAVALDEREGPVEDRCVGSGSAVTGDRSVGQGGQTPHCLILKLSNRSRSQSGNSMIRAIFQDKSGCRPNTNTALNRARIGAPCPNDALMLSTSSISIAQLS